MTTERETSGPGPIEIALSPELVAQAATISMCTHCGRFVPEVDERDLCALCVERLAAADYPRAQFTLDVLGSIFDEAAHFLDLEDVLDLAHEKLGAGGLRLADWREREIDELDDRIAEVKRHNAEVKRLRAPGGKVS